METLNERENYYGAIQFINDEPMVVFGAGHSESEAIEDALNYCDDVESLSVTKITKRLYDYVVENGHSYGQPYLTASFGFVDIE